MRALPLLAASVLLLAGCTALPGGGPDGADGPTGLDDLADFLPTAGELPGGFELVDDAERLAELNMTKNPQSASGGGWLAFDPASYWIGDMFVPLETLVALYANDEGGSLVILAARFAEERHAEGWVGFQAQCDESPQDIAAVLRDDAMAASYVLLRTASPKRSIYEEPTHAERMAVREDSHELADQVAARTGAQDICARQDAFEPEEPNDTRAKAWSQSGIPPSFGPGVLTLSADDVDWFAFEPEVGYDYYSVSVYVEWGDISLRIEDAGGNVLADLVGGNLRDSSSGIGCDFRVRSDRYFIRIAPADEPLGQGYYAFHVNDRDWGSWEMDTYEQQRCPDAPA